MNKEFYPFLYLFIAGIFPKAFQVWDDGFAERDDAVANGIVHILIRVIDKVKQGWYFFILGQVAYLKLNFGKWATIKS